MTDYIVPLDKHDIHVLEAAVFTNGVTGTLDKYLEYLDCTRTFPSGIRIIQTIGLPYRHLVSMFLNLIDRLEDDALKNKYKELLEDRHHKNLEFEKEHPPVIFKSPKKVKNKTEPKEKEKKPSKKVLKQAEKMAKIGKLKINFK